jgi:hypothetical protein
MAKKQASKATPKQRVTSGLARERKAMSALKKAKPGSAAYTKAKAQIKAAQRQQKGGYRSYRAKVTNKKTPDSVRKSSKKRKKSSSKGTKNKNTSKRTRSRGSSKPKSKGGRGKKKR